MLNKINEYIKNGLVEINNHPNLDLYIYNYTQTCQYEGAWDDITLSCRGLILDGAGNIIARPFKKFFNYEEILYKNIIPFNENYVAYEKMDGSLGILFFYNDQWHFATRGSFTSDQALHANEVLNTHYKDKLHLLDKDYTYLFEIIYPENRIVVNYKGCDDIFLLAVIKTQTGEELSINAYDGIFNLVKVYEGVKLNSLPNVISGLNNEGFVIRFESGFRLKLKYPDYVRLHKIMTNLTNVQVWDAIANGTKMSDLLKDIPDEFFDEIKKLEDYFNNEYSRIETYCLDFLKENNFDTKKDLAIFVKQNEIKFSNVIFDIYDNKSNISTKIWKFVKPEKSIKI